NRGCALARFARLRFRSTSRGKMFALENGRPHAPDGSHAMKYEIRIGGKPRVVELTRNSEKLKISLDGKMLDVDAVEIATKKVSRKIKNENLFLRGALLDGNEVFAASGRRPAASMTWRAR